MRGERNTDRSVRKFITIKDELSWEYIDRLMQLDKYKKSFNKVINDALDYGLPELLKAEFGEIDDEEISVRKSDNSHVIVETVDDKKIDEIIDLLEELVLNANISKSILSSLFNERLDCLYGYKVRPDKFENGELRDTPTYLAEHEKQISKRIRDSRRRRI